MGSLLLSWGPNILLAVPHVSKMVTLRHSWVNSVLCKQLDTKVVIRSRTSKKDGHCEPLVQELPC
jgi:hypothetical protein